MSSADRPVALVTGGAKRLGAHFNRMLAGRGYRIALHYHTSDADADTLAREIADGGGEVHRFTGDLTDPDVPTTLVGAVARHFGRLDLLVNSAAGMVRTPIGSITAAQIDAIFALNVRAPFLAAQAAAECMGEGGVIINMADLAAFETWGGYIPHSMSKAAVVQMTRALAKKLAPRIRVNAIAPGRRAPPRGIGRTIGSPPRVHHAAAPQWRSR